MHKYCEQKALVRRFAWSAANTRAYTHKGLGKAGGSLSYTIESGPAVAPLQHTGFTLPYSRCDMHNCPSLATCLGQNSLFGLSHRPRRSERLPLDGPRHKLPHTENGVFLAHSSTAKHLDPPAGGALDKILADAQCGAHD